MIQKKSNVLQDLNAIDKKNIILFFLYETETNDFFDFFYYKKKFCISLFHLF